MRTVDDTLIFEAYRESLVNEAPEDPGEEPRLDNAVGLHPDHGNWANFLKDKELRGEGNGWKWYGYTNHNWFVSPDGLVIKDVFGYHGANLWREIQKDPEKWLREREDIRREIRDTLARIDARHSIDEPSQDEVVHMFQTMNKAALAKATDLYRVSPGKAIEFLSRDRGYRVPMAKELVKMIGISIS